MTKELKRFWLEKIKIKHDPIEINYNVKGVEN